MSLSRFEAGNTIYTECPAKKMHLQKNPLIIINVALGHTVASVKRLQKRKEFPRSISLVCARGLLFALKKRRIFQKPAAKIAQMLSSHPWTRFH